MSIIDNVFKMAHRKHFSVSCCYYYYQDWRESSGGWVPSPRVMEMVPKGPGQVWSLVCLILCLYFLGLWWGELLLPSLVMAESTDVRWIPLEGHTMGHTRLPTICGEVTSSLWKTLTMTPFLTLESTESSERPCAYLRGHGFFTFLVSVCSAPAETLASSSISILPLLPFRAI